LLCFTSLSLSLIYTYNILYDIYYIITLLLFILHFTFIILISLSPFSFNSARLFLTLHPSPLNSQQHNPCPPFRTKGQMAIISISILALALRLRLRLTSTSTLS
jgi:hypothetical protein